MTRLTRTRLVPLEVRHEEQSLEIVESFLPEQPKSAVMVGLPDNYSCDY